MSRFQAVDVFRVLAILAVIALHTARHEGPGAVGSAFDAATFLNQGERFAVPLFFILSGYFWSAKCSGRADYLRCSLALARRVLLLFVAWCAVYFLVSELDTLGRLGVAGTLAAWATRLATMRGGFATLLLQGAKVHLWFLPALAIAALISGALLSRQLERSLFVLAIVLYAIGLAGKAYADTPFGFHIAFNLRNGPFFSLLMFATGHALRRRGPQPSWAATGALLAIGGLLLQLCEAGWLHHRFGTNMAQDFTLGTWPFGLGMAMIALADPRPARIPALAALGPLVLGVYASHYLFVDGLRAVDGIEAGPAGGLRYVMLVFLLSLGFTWIVSRIPVARRAVT
ncbi:acyltransferase [Massilia sp. LXY-6]|uniref:acyltransferase n=1 Tax=Massilia sp. LXY-6 TaxID=3379823 RepID=UPI003EE19911